MNQDAAPNNTTDEPGFSGAENIPAEAVLTDTGDQKFFFHMNVFEITEEDVTEEVEEDLPPPPPVFSESDVEAAKKKAYAEGQLAGKKEAEESQSRALSKVMEAIGQDIKKLYAHEKLREDRFEKDVIALSLEIFNHIFPLYHQTQGFNTLCDHIAEITKMHNGKHAIHIKTSESFAAGVEAFLKDLTTNNPELKVKVSADESIADGAYHVQWSDGGAIYDIPAMAAEIRLRLEDMLEPDNVKGHDEINENTKSSSDLEGDDKLETDDE